MRPLRSLLQLAIAFAALPANADPFTPGERARPSTGLEEFTERRRLEAGLELRAVSRDAGRRTEEMSLRTEGSRADVEHYRQRTRAEDDLDRLVARQEVDARGPGSGFERLGPETRRLLERSHVELRWIERRQDLELRLQELERGMSSPRPYRPSFPLGAPDRD